MAAAEQQPESVNIQLLVDSIPALIHTARPDGYIDYFNKPWLEYFGVTLDKVAGWNWTAYIHPEDVEGIVSGWRACLATGEIFQYETRVLAANGEYRWMFHRKVPLRDANGNIVKWYGSSLDFHERKTAEEKLRRSAEELQRREFYLAEEQRLAHMGTGLHVYGATQQYQRLEPQLQATLNMIPAYTWYALATGGLTFVNERTADYLGLPKDHPLRFGIDTGAEWDSHIPFLHPDDREESRRVWSVCIGTGSAGENSQRVRNAEGEYRWFLSRVEPLRASDGTLLYWIGVNLDIDDTKRAEDALRKSEKELRDVIDTIPAIVWSALPDGSNSYGNKRFLEYSGSSAEQTAGLGWQALIHPDDLERHKGKWMEAVATGKPHENEVRSRRSDGQYRWQLDRGVPLRDEDGNIVKWYGVSTDIEDRKRAEDKIREQETEFRQILDLAPQHVAVYGPNRERLYANRVKLDYLGSSLEEWQQSSGRGKYFHPDDTGRIDVFFDRTVARASADELEVRLRKRDGSYRWFLARLNPLRDDKEQITRWYVVYTDIEDRKRAEERLKQENVALREETDKASMFEEIVGTSPALKSVLSGISKVAPSDSTVLITGETGTGKELVARAIHRRSNRASRAFVSVNCAAIPRELIASELFGHEKGAFTGATQQRLGRFELANGGTLFLDEVGELPSETQIALLRVLQEHEFERVGGTRPIRADVRVIAATNRDLQAAISAGSFRRDLFYRLNVFPIEAPPLRERKEDIRLLVEYFIDRYARKAGKKIASVDKKTLRLLESYPWPGNIRELQNIIERSVIVCETANFSVDESWLSPTTEAKSHLELSQSLAAHEKEMIEVALRESGGRVFGPSGAAAKLGMPRSTLESKIRSLKINKNRFKT